MRKADAERKIRSAEKLFDAIGMIDDRIIADAADLSSSSTSVKKISFLRRYAVSLTAILLAVTMVGGFVIANLSTSETSDSLGNAFDKDESASSHQTLDFILSSAAAYSDADTLTLDEIDFFDGEVSIIWNYAGAEEYYKLTFEAKNAEALVKNCMSKSVEQIATENADNTVCKAWISYGNGEVVSPYLKESSGNIGYAELFLYSPEVVPSESFCELVREALEN